ncbi:hypothetical protein ACEQ8H_001006 [Pleosporales sp. CAS-2024a]
MAPNSPVFLEVDDHGKEPARTSSYLDYLLDQERWIQRDQERQMVRYRDRNHYGVTHQRTGADRLAVPVYEVSPRPPRARSAMGSRMDESTHSFKVREFRPQTENPSDRNEKERDEQDKPTHERITRAAYFNLEDAATHSRQTAFQRPKVKIPPVIIQKEPPEASPAAQRPGISPGSSPRSPSGQPPLQYKYLTLQNKLAGISLACIRYIDVEAASPRDLTFEKISEQVKGFEFDLRVWSKLANIENMAIRREDIPESARAVMDAASRNMSRLIDRATELHHVCVKAKPNDLKVRHPPIVTEEEEEEWFIDVVDDDNDDNDDNNNNNNAEPDATDSMGYIITASLHSIQLQMKNLKRLTRSLQEATPDARDEVRAVASLVNEVAQYFGSEAAERRYPVDTKFSGRRALEEARYRHAAAR